MGPQLLQIPMLGGVNLFTHPSALSEAEITRSKNMAPVNHKRMSKRLGVGYLGGLSGNSDYPIAGIISPHLNFDDVLCLTRPATGAENLTLVSLGDGLTSGAVSVALSWYSKRPWIFSTTQWVSTQLTQFVIVLSGPDAVPAASGGVTPPYPGTSLSTFGTTISSGNFGLSGTNNDYIRPKVASPYKRRIVYANFGPGFENTIVFSDNGSASLVGDDVLAANGRGINLTNAQDGDEIVALVEVMLFNVGSPATSGLLVLRRFGNPFLITGELDQTTGGTSTIDIKRISVNAGCANPYTVARTPYGIIWAGQDDVWCFDYGTVRNVGLKIQPVLRTSPPDQHIWWSGAFHNGFYRLAIWGEGQDFAFPNAPSDQWWLHLDGGLPKSWQDAEWFGPHQILNGALDGTSPTAATRVLLPENRAGYETKLYGVEVGAVSADDVRAVVLVSYDQVRGRDLASNPSVLAIADTDGCEIEGLVVSREMDPVPNLQKSTDGVQGTIRPDNFMKLDVNIITDSGDDKQSLSKGLSPSGFILSSSILDTDRIGEVKPFGFSVYATPGDRPLGTTFQYEIGDTAGYVIKEGYNDSLIVATNIGVSTYLWVPTIPAGTYSLTSLLAEIQTQINAGKPSGAGDNWVVDISLGFVRFRAFNGGNSLTMFILYISSNPVVTDAQEAASRQLMVMLGFDGSANGGSGYFDTGVSPAITAPEQVYSNGTAHYELWGLAANVEVFPRDP